MTRTVLHADESFVNPETRNYLVVAITKDEAGYSVVSEWPTLEKAKSQAAAYNANLGLTEDEVLDIRLSSMLKAQVVESLPDLLEEKEKLEDLGGAVEEDLTPDADDLDWARDDLGETATDDEVYELAARRVRERATESQSEVVDQDSPGAREALAYAAGVDAGVEKGLQMALKAVEDIWPIAWTTARPERTVTAAIRKLMSEGN